MPASSLAVTGGTVETWQLGAGGDHEQVMRESQATAPTLNTWTASTTAQTIAADAGRLRAHIVNLSSFSIYIRTDATAPTTTAFMYRVPPAVQGAPGELTLDAADGAALNIRMVADGTGGTVLTTLGGTTS